MDQREFIRTEGFLHPIPFSVISASPLQFHSLLYNHFPLSQFTSLSFSLSPSLQFHSHSPLSLSPSLLFHNFTLLLLPYFLSSSPNSVVSPLDPPGTNVIAKQLKLTTWVIMAINNNILLLTYRAVYREIIVEAMKAIVYLCLFLLNRPFM